MKKVILFAAAGVMGALLATSCCNCDKNSKCNNEGEGEMIEGEVCPMQKPGHCPGEMRPCCPMGEMKPDCPMGGEMSPKMKEGHEKWRKFDSLSVDEQKALLKSMKEGIDERDSMIAAKKAEMEQKWANFDNLTIEEQKQMIMMKSHWGMPQKGPKHGGPHGEKGGHRGHGGHGPHHDKR